MLLKTYTPRVFQFVQHWLQACRETRSKCHFTFDAGMPGQLLGVSSDKERLCLTGSKSTSDEYATSSYCWRGCSDGVMSLKWNLSEHFVRGIVIAQLPPSLRHAIHFTSWLKVRYILSERFCIEQDVEDDLAHQISSMCMVYCNASLMISSARSETASNGFIGKQCIYESSTIAVERTSSQGADDGKVGLGRNFHHPLLEEHTLSDRVIRLKGKVGAQPVSTGTWCLQERLVSRRILQFTDTSWFGHAMRAHNVGVHDKLPW